jgi:hypothetical protein
MIGSDGEFVRLAADADAATRERLARVATELFAVLLEHPGDHIKAQSTRPDAHRHLDVAVQDFLNPVQADVVRRIRAGFENRDEQ